MSLLSHFYTGSENLINQKSLWLYLSSSIWKTTYYVCRLKMKLGLHLYINTKDILCLKKKCYWYKVTNYFLSNDM